MECLQAADCLTNQLPCNRSLQQTTILICIQLTNLLRTDLVVVYAVAEVAAHEVTLDKVDVVAEHVVTVKVVAVFLTDRLGRGVHGGRGHAR